MTVAKDLKSMWKLVAEFVWKVKEQIKIIRRLTWKKKGGKNFGKFRKKHDKNKTLSIL